MQIWAGSEIVVGGSGVDVVVVLVVVVLVVLVVVVVVLVVSESLDVGSGVDVVVVVVVLVVVVVGAAVADVRNVAMIVEADCVVVAATMPAVGLIPPPQVQQAPRGFSPLEST